MRSRLIVLDLRGAAEMANGIEKYGRLGYMLLCWSKIDVLNPRMNCVITGIGVSESNVQSS